MATVKVIHGAPCSGKTTYVREHAGGNDVVWDYDTIRQALTLGQDHDQGTEAQREMTNKLRYTFAYNAPDSEAENAYFITTRVSDTMKDLLGPNAEYIYMDVSEAECLKRLEEDNTRPDKEYMKQLILDYFAEKEGRTMPIKTDREYRAMTMPQLPDENEYIVEGYATTFNDPYLLFSVDDKDFFETVDSRAFDGTDTSDVIFQYDHSGMVYARTKNDTLQLSVDEHGLKICADLSKTEASRQMYDAIKAGLVDQMSFGFTVDDEDYDRATRTRTIKHFRKLYDVSAVSIPANPGTEISARSAFEGYIEAERLEEMEAEKRRKQIQKIKILTEV